MSRDVARLQAGEYMPLNYWLSTRISVAGTQISNAPNTQYSCRDVGYHQLIDPFTHPEFARLIQSRMPKIQVNFHQLSEELLRTGQWLTAVGTPTDIYNRRKLLMLGTLIRNAHLVDIHTVLRIRGVTEEQIRRVVSKLQQKWRVAYRVEEVARGGLGPDRSSMDVQLVIQGGLEVVPAWWWAIMFMRSTMEIPNWQDATTLLKKIRRGDSIGTASLADIQQCWGMVLAHTDAPAVAYVATSSGPVSLRSSIFAFYPMVRTIYEQWRMYTVDLTPEAERPPLVAYERPVLKKKEKPGAHVTETVTPADEPITFDDEDEDEDGDED